jgi:glutamyl-tRNA reductase
MNANEISAFTVHARAVPAQERLQAAVALRDLLTGHGVVLETCHRVDGYAASTEVAERVARALPNGARTMTGDSAVRHAVAVAVGRDSVVVGEGQIQHQVRDAVIDARASGIDPVLERLFSTALRAGREARSWQVGPQPSLATLALSAIERRTGDLRNLSVLVVGAGQMGRLAAEAARNASAAVTVASRSRRNAAAVARAARASVVGFDPGPDVGRFGAIIVAIGGPWQLEPATEAAIASGSIVVDLSVPRALSPGLTVALGARLVTADDLARDEFAAASDERHIARLDALIARATGDFVRWLDARDRRSAAAALAARADELREAELCALWRRLPETDGATREAVDGMARHFAERLLREPFECLARDRDDSAERKVRDVFSL